MTFDETIVRQALMKSWSLGTAKQWRVDNPALGQCNVTAAVIHNLYGGEILRTRLPRVWHYYNQIAGARYDLTDSLFTSPNALFDAPTSYDDELSDTATAMKGIRKHEFDTLKTSLLAHLGVRH